jgi:hypothetical protein
MLDEPRAAKLLPAVAALLRENLAQPTPHILFLARVAANAVDLAAREAELGPGFEAAEMERLKDLVGEEGDLRERNRRLCDKILSGAYDADPHGLKSHLWAVTLGKVAIDQPSYAAYQRTVKAKAAEGLLGG